VGFCDDGNERLVPQGRGEFFLLFGKVSFLNTLLYIPRCINTYIDPVCPDRLTLRYCSCNTYLLHRRAELKAAPGTTCLMGTWALGNNEPLSLSTYVSVDSYPFVLNPYPTNVENMVSS
jgi:hypothetical protein